MVVIGLNGSKMTDYFRRDSTMFKHVCIVLTAPKVRDATHSWHR